MALLKMKELRGMRTEDVDSKMRELGDELMHERGVAAMGGAPASPGKIRALRTEIARIHTVMREKELAAEKAAAEAPAKKKTETKMKKGGKPAQKEEKK
jgi:large subunit ribosomal protein L29